MRILVKLGGLFLVVVRARVLSPPPNAVDVNEEFWNSLPATH